MVVIKLRTSLSVKIAYIVEKYGMWGMMGVHWIVLNGCSCCRGCGLGLLSILASPMYILCASPSWYHIPVYTTTCCIYYLPYIVVLNLFPSWKRWVSWYFWELNIGEKGQLEVKDGKETCPWSIWSPLSQRCMVRFVSCTQDFGTRLWSHKSSVVTKHI